MKVISGDFPKPYQTILHLHKLEYLRSFIDEAMLLIIGYQIIMTSETYRGVHQQRNFLHSVQQGFPYT